MGKLIEGFWDCHYCGTTGIGGSKRECPNCGKARDENTKFYMNPNEKHYVPKEKAAHINRNPDWICKYCGSLNSDNNKSCSSCGSIRTEDNLNYFENHKKKTNEDSYNSEGTNSQTYHEAHTDKHSNYYDNKTTSPHTSRDNQSHNSRKPFPIHIILIVLVGLIAISGLIYLFIPKEQELTIQDFSWKRNINIERYQTVNENGWNLPTGARLQYTNWEFHHYEQVLDHYETKTKQVARERLVGYEEYVTGHRDLGNGYFEEITSSRPVYETYYETETYQEPIYRDEPIYQIKYYYEIDKWLYERTVTTQGNDKEPYWGNTFLNSDERVSSKNETYYIIGTDKKEKVYTVTLSFDDWNSLSIGQKVKLKISFGHGTIVDK